MRGIEACPAPCDDVVVVVIYDRIRYDTIGEFNYENTGPNSKMGYGVHRPTSLGLGLVLGRFGGELRVGVRVRARVSKLGGELLHQRPQNVTQTSLTICTSFNLPLAHLTLLSEQQNARIYTNKHRFGIVIPLFVQKTGM